MSKYIEREKAIDAVWSARSFEGDYDDRSTYGVLCDAVEAVKRLPQEDAGKEKDPEDRDRIINALRHCSAEAPQSCVGCPYNRHSADCVTALIKDTLDLIEGKG